MSWTEDDHLQFEMEKALWADGEKLRQLTGEDHGPWPLHEEPYVGEQGCPHCFESSGFAHRIVYGGWSEPDYAEADPSNPCPYCHGTGMVECEVRTLEDLDAEAMDEVEGR